MVYLSEQEKVHKRRVRYSGKYPKSYKEKYKEHNPSKYSDTIERVIQKGSTPAGMHIPIMVKEILEFLQIKPGQIGLDATLGYGGHTLEMLKQLDSKGHLYALSLLLVFYDYDQFILCDGQCNRPLTFKNAG